MRKRTGKRRTVHREDNSPDLMLDRVWHGDKLAGASGLRAKDPSGWRHRSLRSSQQERLVGQDLVIDIYVQDVVDLYGADVRLSFNTSIAQVVDANPTLAGTQIQPLATFMSPDFVIKKEANNSAGTIWYAATQINPSPPVSGSGPLACNFAGCARPVRLRCRSPRPSSRRPVGSRSR